MLLEAEQATSGRASARWCRARTAWPGPRAARLARLAAVRRWLRLPMRGARRRLGAAGGGAAAAPPARRCARGLAAPAVEQVQRRLRGRLVGAGLGRAPCRLWGGLASKSVAQQGGAFWTGAWARAWASGSSGKERAAQAAGRLDGGTWAAVDGRRRAGGDRSGALLERLHGLEHFVHMAGDLDAAPLGRAACLRRRSGRCCARCP